MPIDFPNMDSLINRARLRGFRMPETGETEDAYRKAFSVFMRDIDQLESIEIATGTGWDKITPEEMMIHLLSNKPFTEVSNE